MIADTLPKILAYMRAGRCGMRIGLGNNIGHSLRDLHPTSITHTVNIFSVSVFGATLPNPTEVREVKVKYRAVMYRDWSEEES